MKAQRDRYSADFKVKLALEVLQGNRTLNEIASEARAHPSLLTQRKRQLLESLLSVFSDKRVRETKAQEELTGQLKVESA